MTTTRKGYLAILMAFVLMIGTVASAAPRQMESGASSTPGTPDPAGRRPASASLTVTELSHLVSDEQGAHVAVEGTAILQNTGKTPIDLSKVQVYLQDESSKLSIPARVTFSDGKSVLERGEAYRVQLHFAEVPTDAGPMKIIADIPGGGPVQAAIGITIHCSWPPLRCTITITFDL